MYLYYVSRRVVGGGFRVTDDGLGTFKENEVPPLNQIYIYMYMCIYVYKYMYICIKIYIYMHIDFFP